MFTLVPQDWIGSVAAPVTALLQPVADQSGGRYEVIDWLLEVQSGDAQLWLAFQDDPLKPDVAVITQIVPYPRLKALRIVACGGRTRFFEHYSEIENTLLRKFGPQMGCSKYEIVGRVGWTRVLKRFGAVRTDTITEGDLHGQVEQAGTAD